MVSYISSAYNSLKGLLRKEDPIKAFEPSNEHQYVSAYLAAYTPMYIDEIMKATLVGDATLIRWYFEKRDADINIDAQQITLKKLNEIKIIFKIRPLAIAAFLGSKEIVELLLTKSNSETLENYLEHSLREESSLNNKGNYLNKECHQIIMNHMIMGANQAVFTYYQKIRVIKVHLPTFPSYPAEEKEKVKQLWNTCCQAQEIAFEAINSHITVTVLTQLVVQYIFEIPTKALG